MLFHARQIIANLALVALTLPLGVTGLKIREELAPELRGKRSFEERDGVKHTLFKHDATGATLDFVTNSGICETTPGVNQYSGYVNFGNNQSHWFWFFEARNKPNKAPLVLWLNGGPGCSSMIGLFEELGPCKFPVGASTPVLNSYSWNEYANMLFVDQPTGSGFSYGSETVNSTAAAAPFVWTLLQAFFANFLQYKKRELGLFTESYGGHYGPEFAKYFRQKNQEIANSYLPGVKINLIALGINNGWISSNIQEREIPNFLVNNTYRQLINQTMGNAYKAELTQCATNYLLCNQTTGQDTECVTASTACFPVHDKYFPYIGTNYDINDVKQDGNTSSPTHVPTLSNLAYLARPDVLTAIGARSTFLFCSNSVADKFFSTGDIAREYITDLSSIVQSGVKTIIWAGDADANCDHIGNYLAAQAITYPQQSTFVSKALRNYTVNGHVGGQFKTAGDLSWLRVYGAGHTIPTFQPKLALQVFKQIMKDGKISST
ncbi:Alpha/Beta hydrolase protein [Halenospora varia]|nr:Alpha/Beta hydrolase protein [Halenospora varia]